MDRYEIKKFLEDVMFAKEAAEYLGISTQRLNQLVHTEQIQPIKKSPTGNLFLKQDLDKRRESSLSLEKSIKTDKTHVNLDLDNDFMREVTNYFTIQSFYNNSDKKTEPIFHELQKNINFSSKFEDVVHQISLELNISEDVLFKSNRDVLSSFEKLNSKDKIFKKGYIGYPKLLEMTQEAPPYLFMRGNPELLNETIVSVVGSRNATEDGVKKAKILSESLGNYNITVASGLARGIDTAAQSEAIKNNHNTIAVIGTPLNSVYPKENYELQKAIGESGLIISQFPPSAKVQRWHFPMRNAVMSGISFATIIVEAGETSGALKQADYALKQGRHVFIPQSVLDNSNITWPKKYIQRKGAHKFSNMGELLKMLTDIKIIEPNRGQMTLLSEAEEFDNVLRT